MATLKSHQNMALDAYQILKDGKVDNGELERLRRETLADRLVTDGEKRVLKEIFSHIDESKQTVAELANIDKFRKKHQI